MTIGGQASSKRSVRSKPLHAKMRSFHGQMNLDAVTPYRISVGHRLQTRFAFEHAEQELEKFRHRLCTLNHAFDCELERMKPAN
jgi:hypothetical protein